MLSVYNTIIQTKPRIIPKLSGIIFENMKHNLNFMQQIKKIHGSEYDFFDCLNEFKYTHYLNMADVITDSVQYFQDSFNRITKGQENISSKLDLNLKKHHSKCLPGMPPIYIYGGFNRDMLGGKIYNDIDIRFGNEIFIYLFIEYCIPKNYEIIDLQKYVTNGESRYHGKARKIQIITNGYKDYPITLDLTYLFPAGLIPTEIFHEYPDMDVNTIISTGYCQNNLLNIDTYNKKCNLQTTIENCQNRLFIVLNSDGEPIIDHCVDPYYQFDNNGDIIKINNDCYNYIYLNNPKYSNCISKYDNFGKGKYLFKRINKMLSNGWVCLNKPCKNPWCILAPQNLQDKFIRYLALSGIKCGIWKKSSLPNNTMRFNYLSFHRSN
ncbi:hypothetical protein ma188 [Moumouvirus australiensis]|uniref:Uncharacterized protein n=1 Tax=Moumouvirus australiensis TaxID=2109587 RepID=A0A2P1EL39_9VIRU|nr:hypothetical protein QKC55_gp716 [Moumouvirus australiensis]AVL94574.1 hypothetical protein ma188 [Moumouvirus australiensis]